MFELACSFISHLAPVSSLNFVLPAAVADRFVPCARRLLKSHASRPHSLRPSLCSSSRLLLLSQKTRQPSRRRPCSHDFAASRRGCVRGTTGQRGSSSRSGRPGFKLWTLTLIIAVRLASRALAGTLADQGRPSAELIILLTSKSAGTRTYDLVASNLSRRWCTIGVDVRRGLVKNPSSFYADWR